MRETEFDECYNIDYIKEKNNDTFSYSRFNRGEKVNSLTCSLMRKKRKEIF